MASLQLSLPLSLCPTRRPSSRFIDRPVQYSTERQQLFNRIAPVYDNLNDLLSLGQHRVWKRMAVSWSGAKMGDCVLDLCCGSGDLAFLLSEKVGSEGKVTGLDFSREQLSIASSRQKLLPKLCYKNIDWVEGDALDLPFSDGQFDAITMGYGLRNVVDRRKAMQELFRVLKAGSKVSILDFNKSTIPVTALFQLFSGVVWEEALKCFFTDYQSLCSDLLQEKKEWMIDNVVVPVTTSYGLAEEYKYLKSSINEFLTGKELEKLTLEVGFSNARHYEIGGGLMGNLVATR